MNNAETNSNALNETKLFKNNGVGNLIFKEVAVNNNYDKIKERNTTNLPINWELVTYKDKQKVYKTLFLNKRERIITMTPPFFIDDFRLFVKSHNLALDLKLIDVYKDNFIKYCEEININDNKNSNICKNCFICQNNLVNMTIDHYVKNIVNKKIINILKNEFDEKTVNKIYCLINNINDNKSINDCIGNYLVNKRVRKAISRKDYLKKKRGKNISDNVSKVEINTDNLPESVFKEKEKEKENCSNLSLNENCTAFSNIINVGSSDNSIDKQTENIDEGIEIGSSVQNHKKTNLDNCFINNPMVLTKYSTRICPFNLLQKLQKEGNLKVSIQFTSTNDTLDGSSMTKCIVTCSEFSFANGISVKKNKKESKTLACQMFLSQLFPNKLWKDLVYEVTGDTLVE